MGEGGKNSTLSLRLYRKSRLAETFCPCNRRVHRVEMRARGGLAKEGLGGRDSEGGRERGELAFRLCGVESCTCALCAHMSVTHQMECSQS